MGEGMMKFWIEEKGLSRAYFIDSAGTSAFHVGEKADKRMREVAYTHGVNLTSRARQFLKEDLDKFDYIIAMDENNYRNIVSLNSSLESKVLMLREFDEEAFGDLNVPDPYYGGLEGFEEVFQIVMRSCKKLAEKIESM
jgi:protein-tyrosine phosphatase